MISEKFYWLILILFFGIVVFINSPKDFTDLGGDSAQYIILAESIAKGLGFKAINLPSAPFFYHFPPLFPLILSFIIYFFGRNFYLMHILISLFGLSGLFFFYLLFKKYTGRKSIFLIFLLMTNLAFILYSSFYILSDVPYFFFSGFTLYFLFLYINKKDVISKEALFFVLGLILSYFTRYVALTLFFASIFALYFLDSSGKKWRKIIFVSLSFLIPFLIWQITASLFSSSAISGYSKQFFLIDPYRPYLGTITKHPQAVFTRFITGINYYYSILPKAFGILFIKRGTFWNELFSFIFLSLILLGIWVSIHTKQRYCFFYYFFLYLFLIILWPFKEGLRLLLPVLPFFYFYLFKGVEKIFQKRVFSLSFFSILFFINLITLSHIPSFKKQPPPLKNFILIHQWIKKNLPDKGIIVSRKPTVTYLFTQHKSIIYPFSSPQGIWEKIKKEKVKYIIIDEFSYQTYHYLLPFIYKYRKNLKLLYRIGNTGIVEVIRR